MTIRLVTDSTCDLPETVLSDLQVQIVPINIQFGNVTYEENVSIGPGEFYQKVTDEQILPKTSQPTVNAFVEAYQLLGTDASEVISIHVTSKLSGTYENAVQAAKIVKDTVNVTVVDSMAGSAGLGCMVQDAGQMISVGHSVDEIRRRIEEKRPQISLYFAVDTLKYAQMSGRVGKLSTVIGTMLNIKPIIGLSDGMIAVQGRVRSKRAAIEHILSLTRNAVHDSPVQVGVVHAQAPDRAETLMKAAKSSLNVQSAYIEDVAISLAVHFGPGTVGLIAYPFTE